MKFDVQHRDKCSVHWKGHKVTISWERLVAWYAASEKGWRTGVQAAPGIYVYKEVRDGQ